MDIFTLDGTFLGVWQFTSSDAAELNRSVNLHPLFSKIGHPAFCKKQVAKKRGHCNSKREEVAWSFLFLNNNDPVLCTLHFATHILDHFLSSIHKKISGRPDKLE